MKRALIAITVGIAAAVAQTAAYGQDAKKAEALAKQSGCLNCHAVDAKKAGPSFKDISAKSKGAGADKLIANIKAKPIHQASLKQTKEADMKTIVSWITSL
jgi:cytochrome c